MKDLYGHGGARALVVRPVNGGHGPDAQGGLQAVAATEHDADEGIFLAHG